MKIAVSSEGSSLDAATSPIFGRCPLYLIVDTETLAFEAVPNPAMNQGGGAGIQAAQFIVSQGAEAVLTGNLGPNAFEVLQAADVPGYLVPDGTIRNAVEAYKAGRLQPMGQASVAAHGGMGAGVGSGRGERGNLAPPFPSEAAPNPAKETELAELRQTLKSLRQQLADTMERLEQLEKEN
jgi:predicted Fe-Mo cluster-binding NifX family protein